MRAFEESVHLRGMPQQMGMDLRHSGSTGKDKLIADDIVVATTTWRARPECPPVPPGAHDLNRRVQCPKWSAMLCRNRPRSRGHKCCAALRTRDRLFIGERDRRHAAEFRGGLPAYARTCLLAKPVL
jgi:hypothetical protein